MTIQVHKLELQALILKRMQTGEFQDVEDALIHALETAPWPAPQSTPRPTSSDLIAAMQASPHPDLEIEPARYPLPVRDLAF